MQIVLLNQFYPPDVAPTGRYLHELARALVAQGHSVRVIASRHSYGGGGEFPAEETVDGVVVQRLSGFAFGRNSFAGKLADYAAYYLKLAQRLARIPRPDLVLALTTPPFVSVLGSLLAKARGARHAHWLMDLYPDVMHAHGMLDGPPLRLLEQLTRFSLAGADSVVTLGPAMAARAQRYLSNGHQVQWIPLWSLDGLTAWPEDVPVPLRAARGMPEDQLVLLYSGNFGLGHRFDEFLEAARQLGPDGPTWAFAGRGRSRADVERFAAQHPELPLVLLPYVPETQLREHLCSADVHLISMNERWEGTLLPSKLQSSFTVGRPVLFVGRETHDIARWITESGAGWVVDEGDVPGLLRAVEAAADRGERVRRGRAGLAYAAEHFDATRNIARLTSLLV